MPEEGEAIREPASAERRYYHPLQRDYATFLKTSEETGGEFTLIEIELAPCGGNALHYHKAFDEHFEALEGALEVQTGEERRILHPGEKATAAKNVLHCFRNPTDEPARFLVELRPGHTGFENALKTGYGLASDGLARANGAPKNLYYLALLFEWSDSRLPGFFAVAEPLFRFLARRARRKGIDEYLEERYCR
ncbi:MAG TPA: cupin domain-containing protein [Rubrobacteraceae bacterium]|nr:cupin domain-containing protein [Rubrobacteraceae bacterium]